MYSDSASLLVCACVCHESCKKALLDSVNCEYKVKDTLMCDCYSVKCVYMYMWMISSCTLYCICKTNQCTSVHVLYNYTFSDSSH